MGIFSETQITVGCTAVPLFDLDPEPIKESVISSLFGGTSISDGLIEASINGPGRKLKQYYEYGQSNYALGLPSGEFEYMVFDEADIVAHVESLETVPVTVTDVHLEYAEAEFFLKDHLVTEYGYNRFTKQTEEIRLDIVAQMDIDEPAYLQTINDTLQGHIDAERHLVPVDRVVETQTTYLDRPAKKVESFVVTSEDVIRVIPNIIRKNVYLDNDVDADAEGFETYTLNFQSSLSIRAATTASISYVEEVTTYYVFDDDGSETDHLVTKNLPVIIPASNEIFSTLYNYPYQEVFVPDFDRTVGYYYVEYYIVVEDVRVPKHLLYTASERPSAVYPGVGTSDNSAYYPVVLLRDDNTDSTDPANAGNSRYDTSKALLDIYNLDYGDLGNIVNDNPDVDKIDHAFVVMGVKLNTDNQQSKQYLFDYFEYITDVATTVAAFDDVDDTPDYPKKTLSRRVTYGINNLRITEGGLDVELTWTHSEKTLIQGKIGNTGFVKTKLQVLENISVMTLTKQIDENTHKQIKIYNPKHRNYVYGHRNVETTIKTMLEEPDDSNFIVPLHDVVVSNMPVFTQSALFYMAPHLVFYSIEKTKLKWYQTGAFRAIVAIASIYLLITTGIDLYNGFMLALDVSIAAAAIYVATVILNGIILSYAFKYAVKILGTKFAFILAILAVVVSVMGDVGALESLSSFWAENLMQISIGLTDAISENIADSLELLRAEFTAFQGEAESLMEELEEKRELLAPSKLLNPFEFIRVDPLIDLNESSSDFYDRTIHNVNVGPLAFDALHNYVDMQLTLPKPNHDF